MQWDERVVYTIYLESLLEVNSPLVAGDARRALGCTHTL